MFLQQFSTSQKSSKFNLKLGCSVNFHAIISDFTLLSQKCQFSTFNIRIFYQFTISVANITLTLMLSFILSISIEFPFTSIMKLILQQKPNNKSENHFEHCKKNNVIVNNNIKRQRIQREPQQEQQAYCNVKENNKSKLFC